ncbi:hypothetical protein [Arsenophonus nasoniae]|uniref:Lipoprotein n=1 Tax=Arsenophonus nasoniae TaxID=638 RepID=A0AA95GB34_9GAMM|nr:hypothetical protein [Arsenophonus nasoniae]WGL94882.1 hypothetical protein QE207_14505 [Arsenophonus nasoniae]
MDKLIVCIIFLCVLSGCMADNYPKRDNYPAKPLNTQTCNDELNAPNSVCAHSVAPPLN